MVFPFCSNRVALPALKKVLGLSLAVKVFLCLEVCERLGTRSKGSTGSIFLVLSSIFLFIVSIIKRIIKSI